MRRKTKKNLPGTGARAPLPSHAAQDEAHADGPHPRRLGRWLVLLVLGLATFAAFSGVLSNSWIALDDGWYIRDNPHVNTGVTIANLRWFLHAVHGGNWHPVTSYSHMLDVQLFGLNPGAHHAVSLAIHCINVLLLAWVLYRMTGAWWRSVLAAALFGLHPLRVESVAWAAERKDVLSTLFLLLTLDAYRRWVLSPGRLRMAAVMALLALGLMSKPMLVTVPLLLLLLDVWPMGRLQGLPRNFAPHPDFHGLPRRTAFVLVREKWPLFLLVAASAVATLWAQSASHAVISTAAAPVGSRIANAVVSCWRYIGMTLWPVHLIPFYPDAPLGIPLVMGCAAGLLAATILVLAGWRKRPHLAIGWIWYLVALLPVLGLIQVGGQAYADRYTYIPTMGLMIAITWIPRGKSLSRAAFLAAVPVLVVLGILTHRQVARWKDTKTLFTYTLHISPRNAIAYNCVALAKLDEGDEAGAIHDFKAAIAVNPAYRDPYRNLGLLFNRRHACEEALRYCEAGMKIYPDAGLLEQAALANLGLGRVDAAERLFRRSLEQEPDNLVAVRNLAVVRNMQGHPEDAVALLRRVERADPRDPHTPFILGKVLYLQGKQPQLALEQLRRAVQLNPDWPEPLIVLSQVLATDPDSSLRDPAEAARLATRAVELTAGGNVDALNTQALAMAALGRYDAAASATRSALELAKQSGPDSLAAALLQRLTTYEARARTSDRRNPQARSPGAPDEQR